MLYYVGAAGGGVWKSTDGGTSWKSVWKKQPLAAIGALALDPHDGASVWVGTGEANPRNDVSWGDGLWHSTDGAKTWKAAGLAETSQISRISVDPRDAKHLVVAALGDPWHDSTERGIFRTVDGGKTWTKTLYVDGTTGAADLARDPHDPRVLYASMWRFRRAPWIFTSGGGTADGLYKSVDDGLTWHHITGGGFPSAPLGRIGIGIAPSKSARVYAVVQSTGGTIWRSDDAGRTWKRVSTNTLPEQRPFYFSHLAVDPKNPDHVISVSMYLTESKDGGRTWKHVTGTLHPDNHALWWSHDGTRLIDGNDGGVALSNNGGKSWAMPLDLAIGQVYHVGYDLQDPYTVCGGFQDNSSWCAPSNSRNGIGILDRDWFSIAGGDGQFAIPDPCRPIEDLDEYAGRFAQRLRPHGATEYRREPVAERRVHVARGHFRKCLSLQLEFAARVFADRSSRRVFRGRRGVRHARPWRDVDPSQRRPYAQRKIPSARIGWPDLARRLGRRILRYVACDRTLARRLANDLDGKR